jgi:hypothetical protein
MTVLHRKMGIQKVVAICVVNPTFHWFVSNHLEVGLDLEFRIRRHRASCLPNSEPFDS